MLVDDLRNRLKGSVLLLGVGNPIRGDDASGPMLVEKLEGKVKAHLLDVGEIPESYTRRILDFGADTIVVLDAADFGGEPGDVAILEESDLAGVKMSTHQLPFELFFRYLRDNRPADIFVLGIQPRQINLGEPMSPAVSGTVDMLADMFQDLLS